MPRLALTDRAYRYRANRRPPAGERRCAFCGSRRNVEIDHVDGHEENDDPRNKIWLCRPCNTAKGIAMRNAGLGRRTRQYNASKGWEFGSPDIPKRAHRSQILPEKIDDLNRRLAAARSPKAVASLLKKRAALSRESLSQFNAASAGARNLAQWTLAVLSMHRQSNAMSVSDAVEMIKATPQWKREEFAREIWDRRRARGTDRTGEVPF